MEKAILFSRRELYSFFLMFLMVLSSAFVSYDYFNFFKLLLLIFSFFTLLKYFRLKVVLSEIKLVVFVLYAFFLTVFYFKYADEFSYRIVFNLLVTVVCSAAAISVGLYRRHIIFFIPVVFAFSIYNFFFNINFYDGKPQVHAQIFSLVVLCVMAQGFFKSRVANAALLIVVMLSKVRSVLFGILPIIALNFFNITAKSRDLANIFAVSFASLVFWYVYNNFEALHYFLGDSLNSLNWRLYHWNNLFSDTTDAQLLFGNGLGHSWRTTLFIDDFYTDGENYVAAHSNYVKIVSETGLLGLAVFIGLMFFFYTKSNVAVRSLIVFYIGYGFYDEGVWLFSIFWTLLLVSEKGFKND